MNNKFFIYLIFFLLIFPLTFSCNSDTKNEIIDFPEINNESKVWTRWWWHGNSVTKEGILSELNMFHDAGFGGLELTPIFGVIGDEENWIDFLSPEWVDMLIYTLDEASKIGIDIDIATGTGWPFGGPWVKEEDASKYLAFKKYSLKSGEKLSESVEYIQKPIFRKINNNALNIFLNREDKNAKVTSLKFDADPSIFKKLSIQDIKYPFAENSNLQELAIDQLRFEDKLDLVFAMAYSDSGTNLNLTDKIDRNGNLDWVAPEGNWGIYALFEGMHGKMVERAAPGGEGYVIDHFSKDAINNYLQKFDKAFENRDVSKIRAYFNDSYEVDDAQGQSNWTRELFEVFEKKRGYDLKPYLPILLGETQSAEQVRILSDFRETVSDLLLENFTIGWANWAHQNKGIIRNQAHGSPGNILDLYSASDIPETEGTQPLRIKFATSASHVSGKKLVAAEAATWLNEHFISNLGDLKENLDNYLVNGVNHLVYHGSSYSPKDDIWPGRLFYAALHVNSRNPFWEHLKGINNYVSRTQSFLQEGEIDNDILVYFPIYDRYAFPDGELLQHFNGHGKLLDESEFGKDAAQLLRKGYAFDYVSDLQLSKVNFEGTLNTGYSVYNTIVIPPIKYIPIETFKQILFLANQGASVIFHEHLPETVSGFNDFKAKSVHLDSLKKSLEFSEISTGLQKSTFGKGALYLTKNIEIGLDYINIYPEKLVDSGLSYTRRKYNGGTLYFVTNWSGKNIDQWIPLEKTGISATFLDPMTGIRGIGKLRKSNNANNEVYVQLENGSSLFIYISEHKFEGEPWKTYKQTNITQPLSNKWELNFRDGGPQLPGTKELEKPEKWTDFAEESFQTFSGTAVYSTPFVITTDTMDAWLLDLGEVFESAKVIVNDEQVGILAGPNYKIILPKDNLKSENTLEIEVSNSMANRIIDLDKRKVFWKKFYNVNFPPSQRENMGKLGVFDASTWTPLKSGLEGPVTLTGLKIVKK